MREKISKRFFQFYCFFLFFLFPQLDFFCLNWFYQFYSVFFRGKRKLWGFGLMRIFLFVFVHSVFCKTQNCFMNVNRNLVSGWSFVNRVNFVSRFQSLKLFLLFILSYSDFYFKKSRHVGRNAVLAESKIQTRLKKTHSFSQIKSYNYEIRQKNSKRQ